MQLENKIKKGFLFKNFIISINPEESNISTYLSSIYFKNIKIFKSKKISLLKKFMFDFNFEKIFGFGLNEISKEKELLFNIHPQYEYINNIIYKHTTITK